MAAELSCAHFRRVDFLAFMPTRPINHAAIGRYQGKGDDEQSLLRSVLDTLNAGD